MKSLFHGVIKHVVLLAASICCGFLLLVAAYSIPAEWLSQQALESADFLSYEPLYPWGTQHYQSLMDNYTDSIMLNEATYPGDEPFNDAIMIPSFQWDKDNPHKTFVSVWDVTGDVDQDTVDIAVYPRYWHGFLVLLKPLLLVLNYKWIRTLNMIILCVLFAVILLMLKQKTTLGTVAWLLAAACMIPEAVVQSMQYSTTTYVTCIIMIVILLQKKQRPLLWYSLLFAFTGIATVYVDFLTFPTLSLVIPLGTLLACEKERPVKKQLQLAAACGGAWVFGYGGMWVGKWILGNLFAGPDFIRKHVAESVAFRLSDANGKHQYSRIETIQTRLADCFGNPVFATIFGIVIIGLLTKLIYSCIRDHKMYFTKLVPYLLLMLVPFVWTFVLCNHSAIHIYTYRTFVSVIYVLPLCLAVACPWGECARYMKKA